MASLRVNAVDVHGCRSRVTDVGNLPGGPIGPPRPGLADALLPDQPASVSVCRYLAGWLEQGALLSGPALRAFASTLDRLPTGLSRATEPGLIRCRSRGSLGSLDDELASDSEAYRIEARYPSGRTVILIARLGWCGDLGVSNGVRTGQRSQQLATLLTDAVGNGQGWPSTVAP